MIAPILIVLAGVPGANPSQGTHRSPSDIDIPAVDVELGMEFGADFVLRSSRYGLANLGEDEVGHGPSFRVRIGLAFPEDWVAVWLVGDVVSGSFYSERVLAGSEFEARGGTRTGIALEIEIRPQVDGWVPFGRAFMGGSRLGGSEQTASSARCHDNTFTCPGRDTRPLANLAYFGASGGAGLGVAYQGQLRDHLAGVTLELRYTVSDWQSARFEDESGLQSTEVSIENRRARLGSGGASSVLQQVGLIVGFRFGLSDWIAGATVVGGDSPD